MVRTCMINFEANLFQVTLHLLYRDVTLAVWARLWPHGTIHILVSPHEQELDVLATLCALDVTVFTDLTVGLQNKCQTNIKGDVH